MRVSNKKLKELMYLSLIGEYTYMELRDPEVILCYQGATHICHNIVKPLCLTSNKLISDRVTIARITKFEEKVFEKSSKLHKSKLSEEKNFSLDKRIKYFIEDYYKNDKIFDMYKDNLEALQKGRVIDEIQYLGAVEFVTKMRNKVAKENNDKLL